MMTATAIRSREAFYCDLEAFRYFLRQLPHLESTTGLLRAAIAVSMHALDDVNPSRVERHLQALAQRVMQRSPSRTVQALHANLHAVLFEEERLTGNLEHYYNALNSYVPAVLSSRKGIPVTLSLIYKVVGEWAGLQIEGINAPGHFLVRVKYERSWMMVDPFFGGQMLTRDEAFDRLERVAGQRLARADHILAVATHKQWLARIVGNLRHLFAAEGRRDDLAAMMEFAQALASTSH